MKYRKFGPKPVYTYSLEDLDTLNKALGLTLDDMVLSVACSGDQPFSFLEYAGSVVAIDINQAQVNLNAKRMEALKSGDIGKFLEIPDDFCLDKLVLDRNAYFLTQGRLDTISRKLGLLDLRPAADIFEVAKTELGFTKMYFSNALKYAGNNYELTEEEACLMFRGFAENLPVGGLIFVANHSTIFSCPKLPSELDDVLKYHDEKSAVAKESDSGWHPAIYERVN